MKIPYSWILRIGFFHEDTHAHRCVFNQYKYEVFFSFFIFKNRNSNLGRNRHIPEYYASAFSLRHACLQMRFQSIQVWSIFLDFYYKLFVKFVGKITSSKRCKHRIPQYYVSAFFMETHMLTDALSWRHACLQMRFQSIQILRSSLIIRPNIYFVCGQPHAEEKI